LTGLNISKEACIRPTHGATFSSPVFSVAPQAGDCCYMQCSLCITVMQVYCRGRAGEETGSKQYSGATVRAKQQHQHQQSRDIPRSHSRYKAKMHTLH